MLKTIAMRERRRIFMTVLLYGVIIFGLGFYLGRSYECATTRHLLDECIIERDLCIIALDEVYE